MKVLVADTSARGEKIAAAFRAAGCVADHRDALPYSSDSIIYDLTVIHNDQTYLCTNPELSADFVYYYSGGGVAANSAKWFKRPIQGQGITNAEAAQFIQWLLAGQSGPLPSLLGGLNLFLDSFTALAIWVEAARVRKAVGSAAPPFVDLRLPPSLASVGGNLERAQELLDMLRSNGEPPDELLIDALTELAAFIAGEVATDGA